MGRGFGGAGLKGNPKEKRPFSRKHLIHVIFKSSRARGANSFLAPRNAKRVNQIIRSVGRKTGVEIRDYVNVGNHLHLLIKTHHRLCMSRFLRAVGGLLPRLILGCEKGRPLVEPFWDGRPYSKIVAGGLRSFRQIQNYFSKNRRQGVWRPESSQRDSPYLQSSHLRSGDLVAGLARAGP